MKKGTEIGTKCWMRVGDSWKDKSDCRPSLAAGIWIPSQELTMEGGSGCQRVVLWSLYACAHPCSHFWYRVSLKLVVLSCQPTDRTTCTGRVYSRHYYMCIKNTNHSSLWIMSLDLFFPFLFFFFSFLSFLRAFPSPWLWKTFLTFSLALLSLFI